MRNHTETGAGRVALVGVLAALSLIALYLSAVSPTARMGIVAIAGLFPAGAVVSAGLKAGFFCYGAAGLLGLLLVPDKANALLYLLFFGLWPMLKSLLERIPVRPLEWLCKLAVFNAVLTLFWFGLHSLFLPFLPETLQAPCLCGGERSLCDLRRGLLQAHLLLCGPGGQGIAKDFLVWYNF